MFRGKFEELSKKLESAKEMAQLNGIPAESSALVQNCLNEINRTETAYQASIQPPPGPEKDPDHPTTPPQPAKPVIRQKPVTIRSLTKNKTYSIRTEADIDDFLREMRESLINELEENTIIRLS